MAFQTNVFRDGEWVTETVDFEAALKATEAESQDDKRAKYETSPMGILSRTIIQSPVVNFILPVCLRSKDHNDIAFIGDRSIQIKEPRADGQLVEVLSHRHFNARIRNAVVLGNPPEPASEGDEAADGSSDQVKVEPLDQTSGMGSSNDMGVNQYTLPPQILVLMLETGELCFAFIQTKRPEQSLRLFVKKFTPQTKVPYMGFHLVIDPSYRYLAAASPEETMEIYHLKSYHQLAQEYHERGTFNPVLGWHASILNGVIHKVNFLFPRPQDDHHIIMVLFVCRKHYVQSRGWQLLSYDWEAGDSLNTVFSQRKVALRPPELEEPPLFLVPLRYQSTFFMVFRKSVCLVQHALSVPQYQFTHLPAIQKTGLHYGTGEPEWTSWARPFRRRSYAENTDIIYLAREDGVVIHIEVESTSLLQLTTQIGNLDTNIGRAFAAAYDVFSDLLIIGGEAGPGGIWKLPARSDIRQISAVHNWSPVIDVATTDENVSWDATSYANKAGGFPNKPHTKPARVFYATRHGAKGSLVEQRMGMQARIGLDMDFGEPPRQAWVFPDLRQRDGGLHAIIALPYSSAVLRFSPDFREVGSEAVESTPFDLTARTICATQVASNMIIQVTEASITLVTPSQSSRHSFHDLLGLAGTSAQKAQCIDDVIATFVQGERGSHICVFKVDQMNVGPLYSWQSEDEINCLSILHGKGNSYVVCGYLMQGSPCLVVYGLDGRLVAKQGLEEANDRSPIALEALTSMVVAREAIDGADIVAGTRCGNLLTIHLENLSSQPEISWIKEKLGVSPAEVFPNANTSPSAFVCCDGQLLHISNLTEPQRRFDDKSVVWPTDLSDPSLMPPSIHSAFSLRASYPASVRDSMLLLLAGTRILLTEFCAGIEPVPRTISLSGYPSKLLYSRMWKCLIVGVQIDTKPTLVFVDPDSGEEASQALDKEKNKCDFIGGLGSPGDKICGLYEWLYVKHKQTFPFIIVTTVEGNIIIVSLRRLQIDMNQGPPVTRFEYWTRYRKKTLKDPVYSVVPDKEGLLYCGGRTLHWDILDLTQKRMRPVSSLELDSTATSLNLVGGKVLVLTAMHSLQVVERETTPTGHQMTLAHTDAVTRVTGHTIMVGPEANNKRWPVSLVSDLSGGIVGLWAPMDQPHRDLIPMFEGRLKNPVRRFLRTRSRHPWSVKGAVGGHFGTIRCTTDDAEILGVSLNGTLQHFRLLGPEVWRFLYMVQAMVKRRAPEEDGLAFNVLARSWADGAPLELKPGAMHIDGDALTDCFRQRTLEKMSREAKVSHFVFFCLKQIEGGLYTDHIKAEELSQDEMAEHYFTLAYDILEYVLSPAI